jgi:carboxymethylenebutenolidase
MTSGIRVLVSHDGEDLEAYLASPPASPRPRPGVVVLHEIWGLDAHIKDVADRFAREGYYALAPDLFSGRELRGLMTPENIAPALAIARELPPEAQRDPARMEQILSSKPPAIRQAARALLTVMGGDRQEYFAAAAQSAAEFLRVRPGVDPERIASLGFCFGGGISGRLATRDGRLRACVIFYGANPPLDLLPRVRAPILGLYGGRDPRITDTVPDLERAARQAAVRFQYHVYPEAGHAFFNDTRPSVYNASAAQDAWQRVLQFFHKELGSSGVL